MSLIRHRHRLLGAVLTTLVSIPMSHGEGQRSATSEKRGYWWNESPPMAPEAANENRELGPPPAPEALAQLHPQALAKMVDEYREYAVWKPTTETVRWYYEVQDAARRRARAFMNVTELVMLENPTLNMQTVYPANPAGEQARVAERTRSVEERLALEAPRAALILLSRASCEYCAAQREILQFFAQKHGWEVRELDIDMNPAAAARFNTDFVPTTVLIFRDQPLWQPVSVGVETVENIEEGVYSALRYVSGETAAEQYTLKEFQDGGIYDPRRSLR